MWSPEIIYRSHSLLLASRERLQQRQLQSYHKECPVSLLRLEDPVIICVTALYSHFIRALALA